MICVIPNNIKVKARLIPIRTELIILDAVKILGNIVIIIRIPGVKEAPNTMQIIGINSILKNI